MAIFHHHLKILKSRHKKTSLIAGLYFQSIKIEMVPEDGLEPSRSKATDFESVVSTNSTTPATQ